MRPRRKHSGGLPFWPIEPAIVVHVDCGQSGECVEIKPYDERHVQRVHRPNMIQGYIPSRLVSDVITTLRIR